MLSTFGALAAMATAATACVSFFDDPITQLVFAFLFGGIAYCGIALLTRNEMMLLVFDKVKRKL